jgi:hypothetical protein
MAKLITKKEYHKKRMRLQIAAGLVDFLWTLFCVALAFGCVFLLVDLYRWLKNDIPSTFGVFFDIFEHSIHMNGG